MEYRTGEIQDRWNAELDRCRKGGIQARSRVVEPEPPFLLEPVPEKKLLQL